MKDYQRFFSQELRCFQNHHTSAGRRPVERVTNRASASLLVAELIGGVMEAPVDTPLKEASGEIEKPKSKLQLAVPRGDSVVTRGFGGLEVL